MKLRTLKVINKCPIQREGG